MDVFFPGLFPLLDPLYVFAVLLGLILFVPRLAGRLRVPGVVGLLIAGLVIGPFGLNLVARGETAELLSQVGLMFLMFLAGLEIDLHQLSQRRRATLGFGILTFAIPLGLGWPVAMTFGLPWLPALLLASMLSSHTLLTYPLVSRLGLVRDPSVTVTVGGTIVTNLGAFVILAGAAASVQGGADPWFWAGWAGRVALYGLGLGFVVPWIARRGLQRLSEEPEVQFLLVFALLAGSTAAALPAGLEPVIGAFLAGLVLNRFVPEKSVLMNRLQFLGNGLLIPFFLVDVGLVVDLRIFFGPTQAWGLGAFMVAAGLFTKAAAAWLGAWLGGFSPLQGLLMYGLSVNQAAGTLAAVLVGRRLGLFDDAVVAATVLMILATCLIGPLVTEKAARALARQSRRSDSRLGRSPVQRLMVSLAHPQTQRALIDLASWLLPRGSGARLFPTVVVQDDAEVEDRLVGAESQIREALAQLSPLGLDVQEVTGLDPDVGHGLLRVARARRADTLLLGWNGDFSLGRSLFGSVLDKVIEAAPQRLVILKAVRPWTSLKRLVLVLPTFIDTLEDVQTPLDLVLQLARQLSLRLELQGPLALITALRRGWQEKGQTLNLSQTPLEPNQLADRRWVPSVGPDDLVVLLAARPSQAAWSPALARKPAYLSRACPRNSLLVIYPALEQLSDPEGTDVLSATQAPPLPPISAQREGSWAEGQVLEDALRDLLAQDFLPDAAERLAQVLAVSSARHPIFLRPGHELVHLHTRAAAAFWIGRLTGGPREVSVLLSPKGESHENHLRVLAHLAHQIREQAPKPE